MIRLLAQTTQQQVERHNTIIYAVIGVVALYAVFRLVQHFLKKK